MEPTLLSRHAAQLDPRAPSNADATPVELTIEDSSITGVRAVAEPAEFDSVYQGQIAAWRESRYIDFPHQVGIESQAVCNASCDFCPYPTMKRRGDRMSDALIEKILTDLEDMPRDLPFDISFSRMNEPFLDKRIFDMCEEVRTRLQQASLWIFTNASPLIPKVAARLSAVERVTQFVVSFNDHRPDEYERVMQIPYARTVANLDALHEMHVAGALSFTPLISRVGDGSRWDEAFIHWCRDRWPRFGVRSTARFDWLGSVPMAMQASIPAVGCWQWFHLPILASGQTAFCCLDHEGTAGFGDVTERHALEVYNEPSRRRLRLEAKTRLDVEGCARCGHY